MRKAVAYLRVSSEEQNLQRQREDIAEFATSKNLKLVRVFEDTVSGSKTDAEQREGFIQLEKYLEDNKDITDILVLEISRLGRKNRDILNVVEKYAEQGICIHFKDLGISTLEPNGSRSIASEMLISLFGIMVANESRLLSSRIKSGKLSSAKKNKAFGGKIIGFKKGKDGTPIIDNDEAPIIKKIFELCASGLGMRSISAMIETEFDRKLHMSTLGGIIRNPFHKGERVYMDLTLEVEPIVSKELWQKANDSMNSRSKFGTKTKVHTNVVEGRIKCHCGNPMYQRVIESGRLNLYICKDPKCKNSINRPWLFRMVKKVVERHAKKQKDEQYKKDIDLQITSLEAQIQLNNREEKKLTERKSKAMDLYMDGDFSKEEWETKRSEIEGRYQIIKADNSKLKEYIELLRNDRKSEIKHFSDDLEEFKIEIKDVVNYVEVDKNSVIINVFGRWSYDLEKPNPSKLGWESKKPESERYKNEELPLRFPIEDDDIDMMVDDYLKEKSK
ncbi:Site-specific DNA recombinase [Arenibacter nanhaiticus]|uniref:Site-specific DNA recombinase n=1 Tax=Arenibacter nanhaiticus TaxID=558155 RepID=A0A1M6FPW3_9FLAO|nr:recombinase family protein [Arenibacter nanhaiticus]SHI99710.1 Site-specific DNA recombinase [Arenibacter nanhaiticus]